MDQDQFDAFTRVLATSTSRRQTLKILLSGFLLSSYIPSFSSPTLASQTQPAGITPLPENLIKGPCQSIHNYEMRTGVTYRNKDGILENKPGAAGETTVHFTYAAFTPKATAMNKLLCSCDEGLYDDSATCLRNCKPSLGCFSNICSPVIYVQTTKPVSVTFRAETEAFGLDWQPPRGSKRACRNAIANWKQRIFAHESHHVTDAENVAKATTNKWRTKGPHSYAAYGNTQQEAVEKIKKQIQRDVQRYISAAEKDYQVLSDQFHRTKEGSPIIDPDCSQC